MAPSDLEVRAAAFVMGAVYLWMGIRFFGPGWRQHEKAGAPVRSSGRVPEIVDRLWVATQGWVLLGLAAAFLYPAALAWSPVSLLSLSSLPLLAAGAAVMVAGCGLVVWASKHLGAELTVAIEAREGGRLVTSGPYSRIRHPIYTGVFLIIAGEALAFAAPLLAAYTIVAVICATLRARAEEGMLSADPVHGAAYRAYFERSGRFFPGSPRKAHPPPGA